MVWLVLAAICVCRSLPLALAAQVQSDLLLIGIFPCPLHQPHNQTLPAWSHSSPTEYRRPWDYDHQQLNQNDQPLSNIELPRTIEPRVYQTLQLCHGIITLENCSTKSLARTTNALWIQCCSLPSNDNEQIHNMAHAASDAYTFMALPCDLSWLHCLIRQYFSDGPILARLIRYRSVKPHVQRPCMLLRLLLKRHLPQPHGFRMASA